MKKYSTEALTDLVVKELEKVGGGVFLPRGSRLNEQGLVSEWVEKITKLRNAGGVYGRLHVREGETSDVFFRHGTSRSTHGLYLRSYMARWPYDVKLEPFGKNLVTGKITRVDEVEQREQEQQIVIATVAEPEAESEDARRLAAALDPARARTVFELDPIVDSPGEDAAAPDETDALALRLLDRVMQMLAEDAELRRRYHTLVDSYEELKRQYDKALDAIKRLRDDQNRGAAIRDKLSPAARAQLDALRKDLDK